MASITRPPRESAVTAKKESEFIKRLKKSRTPWLYILPAITLMFIITLIPQIFQWWMAFTDYTITNLRFNPLIRESYEYLPESVGFENFRRVLTSDLPIPNYNFFRIFSFNVVWTFTNVIIHVVLGIAIALALNTKNLVGRRVYRSLFIIPWAVPQMVAAAVWANMFHDKFGAINQFIEVINLSLGTVIPDATRWLAKTHTEGWLTFLPLSFFAALITNSWLGWPFMTLVATGALQSIPGELYEAADIDGATGWQKLRQITLPLLRPAMVPAVMLGTIWTFNAFNILYFVTGGGPKGRTEILVTQAFKLVFNQRLYGIAAAFAIVVFFILLFITLIQNRITRATEAYDV